MRTSSADAAETSPTIPSAGRMFALGIPFWLCIVGGSALSHTLKGWQWDVSHLPTDLAIIFGGAGIGAGIYAFLRRNTALEFNRQIAAALLLILVIAIPTESMLRGLKLINPIAKPKPAYENVMLFPGPNGKVRRQVVRFPAEPATAAQMFRPKEVLRGGIFWLAIFSLWAAVCIAMLRDREARHRERRMAALQAEAYDAQVRALRYQVNPHFLYNTLSSISTLILEGKSEVAERMTMQLSAFFRASLATDPFQDVRLGDELALQRLYLQIEQTRFADSLKVEYDVPAVLDDALVPSLILQPLIENSIKHGLQEAGKITVLTISARKVAERLVLEVADNGRGPGCEHGTGVGLGNVRRRLTTRFGSSCRFLAGAVERGGFAVRLEMPLQLAA
ncbi:MAG TPA: histidine kinase [Allosphingosinicella sp.]|uniref:sensor histidine kinase n=1 Tax=Allosphingosinicella sp. TaxID=2823234 RepID=UPI002F2A0FF4